MIDPCPKCRKRTENNQNDQQVLGAASLSHHAISLETEPTPTMITADRGGATSSNTHHPKSGHLLFATAPLKNFPGNIRGLHDSGISSLFALAFLLAWGHFSIHLRTVDPVVAGSSPVALA